MKRYFFRAHKWDAVNGLFGGQKDFDPRRYETYEELEVVQQDDGRFSVWGNFAEDTDLLRDTRKDTQGAFRRSCGSRGRSGGRRGLTGI